MLGKENDLYFSTKSQIQWVGRSKFVTLMEDKYQNLQLVQLLCESDKYAEVRSIHDFGHHTLQRFETQISQAREN